MNSNLLDNLVWLFALLLGVPLVLGPVIAYFTQTITRRPRRRETRADDLAPKMAEYLGQMARQLGDEGFEAVANMCNEKSVPGVNGIQVLFVNRRSNDLALVIMTWAQLKKSMLITLRSEFPDGTRLTTAANPGISAGGLFPRDPQVNSQNFPWVKEPAVLCEAHRRRLQAARKTNVARVAPLPGRELEYYDLDWDRSCEWHVRCGYRYLDERAGLYRFTVKGALLGTWKLVRPVRDIRKWLRAREARREWEALGMDNFLLTRVAPVAN
jgi:hypothetical protein